MKIVQCVPNISEGRDQQKINKIIEPLKNKEGFHLVSVEADFDYNRSVITLLGDPKKMIEPLLKFIEIAKQEIDLNTHKGEHPRMGAVDVIPFIPIENTTMKECIDYANILSKKIIDELEISVYLYAEAAKTPLRQSLPEIRKGEFEGIKEKIKDPLWAPDYGPAHIHPTFGVVAVGARMPLIAYNIDLDTDDEKIALHIAKAIRKSSGGFQYVQAGPATLMKRGHVQVTMNILNYKKNPIYRILETVKMEAKRYKVRITSSEVVGLIPKKAILESLNYYINCEDIDSLEEITVYAKKYLLFRDFDVSKIIEANIEENL